MGGTRIRFGWMVAAATAVAVIASACGNGDDPEPEAAPSPEPEAVEEEAPESFEVDPSPVSATIGDSAAEVYGDPPFEPGEMEAHWYQSEGSYVVIYAGFSAADTPMCPGNSIDADGAFQHVTNAPTSEESACDGFATPRPTVPPRVCDGLIVYRTDIPTETEGILFGSLEVADGEGGIAGATSTVPTDLANTPEIDYEASVYAVPDDFLPDGTTMVNC